MRDEVRDDCGDVTLDDIVAARDRIAGSVYYSPCPPSLPLSETVADKMPGAKLFCKLDYLQRTGSFKERGASNALRLLSEEQRRKGVVTASAGNHALGLAYHGQLLGIPVRVVMPLYAPLIKVSTCERLGAEIILHGGGYDEAKAYALEISKQSRQAFIHGFDDAEIIAGQGTMALEILEQVPDLDAIIVPIGGGGLIAGMSIALKSLRPEVEIIGVEPENVASFKAALAAGHPVKFANRVTLADGLAVAEVGPRAFALAKDKIDRLLTVTEDDLALAVLRLAEMEKSIVEGAGAAAFAACLAGKAPELAGKRVVVPLCGGNIDPNVLCRTIQRALVDEGRLYRFTANISDRPGGLAEFCTRVSQAGASIREVTHERAFADLDISRANITCTVETRDQAHIDSLRAHLEQAGFATAQI